MTRESTEISCNFFRYEVGANKRNGDKNLKSLVLFSSGCIDWSRERRAPRSPYKLRNCCSAKTKFNHANHSSNKINTTKCAHKPICSRLKLSASETLQYYKKTTHRRHTQSQSSAQCYIALKIPVQ